MLENALEKALKKHGKERGAGMPREASRHRLGRRTAQGPMPVEKRGKALQLRCG